MHNHRLEADVLEHRDILDDRALELLIHHRRTTIFHDHRAAGKPPDVGDCLDEHLSLQYLCFHPMVFQLL
ncbi:hypothetical protein SDC9_133443 [bioreactor metagenome]|uniref:Uncharacterized protein n=1 Tax=bioreactor metagenome TaxID=1076179 RepID=A0A645DAI0_9ZZZZ